MIRLAISALIALTAQPLLAEEQTRFKEYFEALPIFWDQIYANGGKTLYCKKKFGPMRGHRINIEHVFPMSWVVRAEGCRSRKLCRKNSSRFNRIEADMHNLYPARVDINKIRSSFAFAEIAGEQRNFGRCDFEFHPRKRVVEPSPESRGNIARAMFHMHHSYDLPLFKKQGSMLKRWHRQDPPDKTEKERHERIAKYQGTRNLFIDNPNKANELGF